MKSPGRLPIQNPLHPYNPARATRDHTFKCPRKGPLTETITSSTCVQMNERNPWSCTEYRCSAHQDAMRVSEAIKLMMAKDVRVSVGRS